MNALQLSKDLIACPSITPEEGGAITYLEQQLSKIGFKCHILTFIDKESPAVTNLFARYGTGSPHICFAGHTDVVPPGDLDRWLFPPFEPEVHNGVLYGRGAVDMKTAIACFIAAASDFISPEFTGSISFMITGDEEGSAINGTPKLLDWVVKNNQTPDFCIIGEPTATTEAGDTIKIGRRGSMTSLITVQGKQGHVAYPEAADNPIPHMLEILNELSSTVLDKGNDFFTQSNLEITTIDVANPTTNIIPDSITARVSIRFNTHHTSEDLKKWIAATVAKHCKNYHIDTKVSGEPFVSENEKLLNTVQKAITKVCGKLAEVSASGGTSDGRYIYKYCPIIEVGLPHTTAHQINECVALSDIERLTAIYGEILRITHSKV